MSALPNKKYLLIIILPQEHRYNRNKNAQLILVIMIDQLIYNI